MPIDLLSKNRCLCCRRLMTCSRKFWKKINITRCYGIVCLGCIPKFKPARHIVWRDLSPNVDSVLVFLYPRGPARYFRYTPDEKRTRERAVFRALVRSAQQRQYCSIDADYLARLWGAQGGCCALSSIPMDVDSRRCSPGQWRINPWRVSLDRIDSKRGYVPGNVRLVCYIANVARLNFTDAELFFFCDAVTTARAGERVPEPPLPPLPPLDFDLPPLDFLLDRRGPPQ